MTANRERLSQQFNSKTGIRCPGSTENGAGWVFWQLSARRRDWLARLSALLPRCLPRRRGSGDEGGQDRDLATAVRTCLDRRYPGPHLAVVLGSGQRRRLACLLRRQSRGELLGTPDRVRLISARG
jgi:hypothetical protein